MKYMVDIQDVIDLLQMNREEEYKKSLSAECKHKSVIRSKHDAHVAFCDYLIECVKQLSSAQPERKKGRWIRNDNGTYSCSICQSWIPEEQHHYARYCLYCGADMRNEAREYLEYGKLIAKGIEQGLRGDSNEQR